MGVIPFIQCRVWFYVSDGSNIIRQWLTDIKASSADRVALQSLVQICEFSGPRGLSSNMLDLGDGFFALKCIRKGGMGLSPVFCEGPFSDTEITFLAGARLVGKTLRPRYAKGVAEENLEELRKDPQRRRRERVD